MDTLLRILVPRKIRFEAQVAVRHLLSGGDKLARRTAEARRQLETDLALLEATAPPRQAPGLPEDAASPIGLTQGGVLLHLYEELTQHLGQLELTRDVLVARPGT